MLNILFILFAKQANLMGRSMVLSLPLQLVFRGENDVVGQMLQRRKKCWIILIFFAIHFTKLIDTPFN